MMVTDQIDTLHVIDRLRLFTRLMRDARVAFWAKALVPVLTAAYFIWPIDVIPDFFIGVGQIDDLGVIGLSVIIATRLLPKLSPDPVVEEHLREMRGAPGPTAGSSQKTSQQARAERTNRGATAEPKGDVIDASYRVHEGKNA